MAEQARRQRTYEEGLQTGQIMALEKITGEHKDRLDHHSDRLRFLERIIWGLVGASALIQFGPLVAGFLKNMGQ